MKRKDRFQSSQLNRADYPWLAQFLRGYLNQDVLAEYGTPMTAANAFRHDAEASQLGQLQDEVRRFEQAVQTMPLEEVNALLSELGSSWIFQSQKEFRSFTSTLLAKSPRE